MRLPAIALLGLAALLAADQPPKEAKRAFDKAAAAARAKQDEEAIRDFQQAVALFPGYAEAWYELGKLELTHKDTAAARSSFEAAIRADGKYAQPYMELVVLEQASGNWKRLAELTSQFLQIDAVDYPQTWLLNAVANYNLRDMDAAEKSAREAERLDTRMKFAEARRLLGLILERRADYAGAVEQFRIFLQAQPGAADAEAIRARLADDVKRAGFSPEPEAGLTFRTETSLAVVRFQVHPNKGEPAGNLTADDIEVRQDGVSQKIAVFEGGSSKPRTIPVEIALLFDCSGSVDRIAALNGRVFRDTVLDEYPNVSLSVYGFSDTLVRFAAPTRDSALLKKAMDLVASIPKRDTPLFGSIADTIRDGATTGANVIRMLVVFSDGESSSSGDESRAGEAEKAARDSGTAIFPVMLDKSGGTPMSAVDSIHDFMSLATATGGRVFKGFMGTDVLPQVLKAAATEIRADYVVGFYVPSGDGKKRHQVEIVLRTKDRGRLYGGTRTLVW